jgi:hypothetical protein
VILGFVFDWVGAFLSIPFTVLELSD